MQQEKSANVSECTKTVEKLLFAALPSRLLLFSSLSFLQVNPIRNSIYFSFNYRLSIDYFKRRRFSPIPLTIIRAYARIMKILRDQRWNSFVEGPESV